MEPLIGDVKWAEGGPWRVYWSEHGVEAGVHKGSQFVSDQRLEYGDGGRIVWKDCDQGSKHVPLLRGDFIAWLDQGGN